MNDLPKSKWYKRWLRRGLMAVAVLATLLAVLVTEENWRGKHDWDAYKRAAEARGERLDMASVVPPPVPDDQNFFCAPIVAQALKSGSDTNLVNPLSFWRGDQLNCPTFWNIQQKGDLTDLKPWTTYFRAFNATAEGKTNGYPVAAQPQSPAADVLLALSIYDPALTELRSASQRPYARMPLNYNNDFESVAELMPWLANTKRCAQFLDLRILAEEQDHQPDQALADLKLQLRVVDYALQQPFLISYLVRIAIISVALQPVHEGLAQHCWSDAQLTDLERVLAGVDLLAGCQYVLKGEEVFAIDTFEKQRITRRILFSEEHSGTNRMVTTSLRWTPAAYFYQNELSFARTYDQIFSSLDLTNRIVSPEAFNRLKADLAAQQKRASIYSFQALAAASAVAASVKKFAFVQTQLDLARTACALERYRLAHNSYPESLDALVPQFIEKLPHDIINGQPLHYHRSEDGKFVLYSVGWNGTDDGGTMVFTKNGQQDRDKGDWVWEQP
jgi:hypothetical protein